MPANSIPYLPCLHARLSHSFSKLGEAAVTIWRKLRRLNDDAPIGTLQKTQQAADQALWTSQ
ncbi:hypothetical protein [Nitrosomonas communis]|uniref:hypothetical protein n=1 Tax=Nitrosomonas communis TaxID=44574 RepID=UPI001160BC0E|nr:hypothetical protein [Nitrosomonas communis]